MLSTTTDLKLQAVIFDFDGLMIDTENAEFQAWSSVFVDYGAVLSMSEWSQCVGGGPDVWSVEKHFTQLCPGANIDQAVASWKARRDSMIHELPPKEGAIELIESLEANMIPFGIASSSRSVWVEGLLHNLGLRERFSVIWTRDKAGKPKPWPEVYLKACDELGVDTQFSVALEDSPNGCRAALAAGMKVVGCPNDVTRHFFENDLCDLRIESLLQIDAISLSGLFK